MGGNPVADKRLLKLIQQCRTKQVLDYVKQHGEDAPKSNGNVANNTSVTKKSKSKKSKTTSESNEPKHKMVVKRYDDKTLKVIHLPQLAIDFSLKSKLIFHFRSFTMIV